MGIVDIVLKIKQGGLFLMTNIKEEMDLLEDIFSEEFLLGATQRSGERLDEAMSIINKLEERFE